MTAMPVRLGDLTQIKTGKLDANASSETGDYPFFTCSREPLRIDSYSYDCECVLVAGNGDLNVKYYQGKFDAYQRTYIVEAKPHLADQVHVRYIYHFLERHLETLRKQSIGGVIKYIKLGNLTDAQIPLPHKNGKPDLEEQKRIAAILDKADGIRRKRQQALRLTDDFLRSVFLDMFGDPVTNPKGLPKGELGDLVERLDGGKNIAEASSKTDYRVLKVSAVTYGDYRPNESKFVPAEFEVPESYLVRAGDLLVSRANTRELIGATAYVWETPPNIMLPDKIWKFIWRDGKATDPLFVHALTRLPGVQAEIGKRASGSSGSMKNIAKPKLLGLPIPIPSPKQQRAFGDIARKVRAASLRLTDSETSPDDLFASLQQRAFRGEL